MKDINGAELNAFLGELLEGGKAASIPARGISMAPFIRDGDLITVTPAFRPDLDRLKLGDLILFRTEHDRWLVHRVVRRTVDGKREKVITKGDSLLQADKPIDLEQVWGRVTVVERSELSRRYELEKPSVSKLIFALALLARMEVALFSTCLLLFPSLSKSIRIKRALRAPKWVLTKVLFP